MGIECFLADTELLGQIVHGHAPKSVTKKVCPRRIHDPLPIAIVVSPARFICLLH
jgi:hypothetical protein